MKRTTKPQTKTIAYNPLTRRYEEVFPEDEIPAHKIITLYWSVNRWVTIPENER